MQICEQLVYTEPAGCKPSLLGLMQVSRKAIRLGLMIHSRSREIIRQLGPFLYQHLHEWGLLNLLRGRSRTP